MARFFAAPAQWNAGLVTLDAAEARHACEVLRLREGASLEVFDGEGRRARGRLAETSRARALVRVEEPVLTPRADAQVTLFQAVPKGKLFEWIVEKSTELGVGRIVPLMTDRGIARVDAADAQRKCEKWRRVALEACKQCGQDWLPEVIEPVTLSRISSAHFTGGSLGLVASLRPGALRASRVLAASGTPGGVSVFVGPEGDFTETEYDILVERGVHEVTLGPRVLRVETAAVSLLSVVSEALGL
jgi:16S rRNA (uracil1498-N3)-methyltransferase